jgi:hypothetical protein
MLPKSTSILFPIFWTGLLERNRNAYSELGNWFWTMKCSQISQVHYSFAYGNYL